VSRPMSERRAGCSLLLGHGPGALAPEPAALRAALDAQGGPRQGGVQLWLDSTLSLTVLAEPGVQFADAAAATAWARRVWSQLDGAEWATALPGAAFKDGAGRCGVTLLSDAGAVAACTAALQAAGRAVRGVAPLWAGVLAAWCAAERPAGPARLIVAEGRSLTLIDWADEGLAGWSTQALPEADAAALAALPHPPGRTVWLAGHGLPGTAPPGVRGVPGLGEPAQEVAALLAALSTTGSAQAVQPALQPRPPMSPRVALAFAGVAALVLVLAGAEAWQARSNHIEALALLQAAQSPRSRATAPQAAAERAAHTRLAEPWAARFAVAEATVPDGGRWLRLEQRAGQPRLLLAGRAGDAAEAFAVAQRLALHPAVAEAAVLRSEAAAAGSGRSAFEIGVTLRQPGAGR
jgi:hypothetical protein